MHLEQPEERTPKDEAGQPSSQTVSTEVQCESPSAIPQIQIPIVEREFAKFDCGQLLRPLWCGMSQ
jgi:hypothetical protein